MPKVNKRIRARALTASHRHEPLGQVIADDERRKVYVARSKHKSKIDPDDTTGELDARATHSILNLAKTQKREIEAEESAKSRARFQDIDQEEDDDEIDQELVDDEYIVSSNGYVDVAEGTLNPEDERLVNELMNPTAGRKNLADMILSKLEEKETDQQMNESAIPPKVVEVYTEIGKLLARYTSGKLPKAFKVIPSLSNWEEILVLTRPESWTPQAMFMATRLFASNLNPKLAQKFYKLVLLDAVRFDIQRNKKLNYHYYMALKKCVYKPAAFFKGILLPLVESSCSLREAAIVGSVLTRVSIPVHHSAVAIHKLAQLETYSASCSIFLKVLLNKKYSLPAPVILSLVRHFTRFRSFTSTLPVLWHQSLLVFVQRYKHEIKEKEALKALMKTHFHRTITPEIRRELFGKAAYEQERMDVS